MGSGGGSGGGTTTVVNEASPETQRAVEFRLNEAEAARQASGGAGYFANPANSPWQMTEAQREAAARGGEFARNNLGPSPYENYFAKEMPSLASGFAEISRRPIADQAWQTGVQDLAAGYAGQSAANQRQWDTGAIDLTNYLMGHHPVDQKWENAAAMGWGLANSPITAAPVDTSGTGVDWRPTATTYDPVASADTMTNVETARIDPEGAIQAARKQLEIISSPAIRNALQAAGLGRSGAEAEALAREGVNLELPIQKQIIESNMRANELNAQIEARQEEVAFLEQQKAYLQAQQLSAASEREAMQVQGQIESIEAQIQGHIAAAQIAANASMANTQRTAALNFASNTLQQMMAGNIAQQQTMATTGTNLLGQQAQTDLGYANTYAQMGTNVLGQYGGFLNNQRAGEIQANQAILNNYQNMALGQPQLANQYYTAGLAGAQADLGYASLQQQMDAQNFMDARNYYNTMLGATPLGPGGSSQQTSQNPGWLQYAGAGAQVAGQFL